MHEAALARSGMTAAEVLSAARELVRGERNGVANMANLSALLFHALGDCNWLGFYVLRGEELVVGPFQGKPACVRIAVGRGVCGTAIAEDRTLVVDDVEAFPGHIACDGASKSEIVIPFRCGGTRALLDVDSPREARFGGGEKDLLEAVVKLLAAGSEPGSF
jgi:L-methionine (R)-S-oxide reductase